jgi:DNA-binding transcriptional regulator YdaS (Cro superfamily)
MQLKEWQTQNKISNRALAQMIENPKYESMLSHYHAGRKSISPESASAIEQATGGEVTLRELLFPHEQGQAQE